jgi:diguanylate cyclase (GGDEF)-like protein/PAS domain S-box-containing protein
VDQSQDLSTAGQGFVAVDRHSGNIVAVDRGLSVATGWSREALVGYHWSKIVHYTDRDAAISSVSGLLESGDGRWTCRIRHASGDFALYQCDASVDSDGQTFFVVVRDSREMARQQQDLSQYARLSDLVEDVLVVTDAQGNVITINKAGERVHGFARDEMIGHHLSDFLPDEGLQVLVEIQNRVEAGETVIDFQIPAFGADGNLVYLEGLTTFDYESKRFYTVERNITERVNRERELEIGHRFFNLSASHLALIDNHGRILRANQALHDFVSREDDLTGEELPAVLGVGPSGRLADSLQWVARCRSDDEFTAELIVGDEQRTVAVTLTASTDGNGVYYSGRDITEEQWLSAALYDRATTDQLTRLATRQVFTEQLEAVLDGGFSAGVIMLDLDDFKRINDALGHGAGDELLRQVADRVDDVVRNSDLVARFGGDEFVILLRDVWSTRMALSLAERVRVALADPFELDGRRTHITTSLGVALGSARTHDPETLMREADAAVYEAKNSGRNVARLFDDELEQQINRERQVEADLRQALDSDGVDFDVQGLFSIAGPMVGLEVLVRLRTAAGDRREPAHFLDVARRLGLLAPLGEVTFSLAMQRLAPWLEADESRTMNLNADPAEIAAPDFVRGFRSALDSNGVRPAQVTLEVTESGLLEPDSRASRALEEIRSLGTRIAIDDFGTGASSLGYLRDLRVDQLKIDRTFVEGMPDNPVTRAITSSVVKLAGELGIDVVAEGVAEDRHLDILRDLGCPLVQGFLLHRPEPIADFLARDSKTAAVVTQP